MDNSEREARQKRADHVIEAAEYPQLMRSRSLTNPEQAKYKASLEAADAIGRTLGSER